MIWSMVRPLLFQLDAETAHALTLRLLAGQPQLLGRILGALQGRRRLPTRVGGLTWSSPVGLAAGLDKDGVALPFWEHLGFGSVEIGTVTAHPQLGNPLPRLHRLVQDRAVINRMGFNNHGSEAMATTLQRFKDRGTWPGVPVGVNLGKSKITPLDRAVDDYLISLDRLLPFADWITINVSSPNTPGLRDLQQATQLRALLEPILARAGGTPVWLKLSPDLADADLDDAVNTAIEAGVAGLIATNTTLGRGGLSQPTELQGGLSGAPLWPIALDRIRRVLATTAGRVPIIGVGGVHGAEQVRTLLDAGCQGVQLYTGLIYEGPRLPTKITAGLA